jgi:hypothetical protein
MTRGNIAIFSLVLVLGWCASAFAQTPRLVRYTGVVQDAPGVPRTGVVTLAFRLYAEQYGGVPLFLEAQSLTLDAEGRYTVLLGSTMPEGLPIELFTSGEARWLGIQPDGSEELPRVLLVSVPYALKAADADTIGGKPASAFVLADKTTVVSSSTSGDGFSALATSGTPGHLGVFTSSTDLGNSSIFETGGKIGVGTTTPAAPFHSIGREAPGAFFDVYSNVLGALPIVFRAARGTPEAPSAVQAHDILGGLAVRGYATTGFPGGKGQVMFRAAENWNDSATGTYLQMTTTPVGSTAFLERLRIEANGNVGIGVPAPAQKLSVAGTIESTTGGYKFPDGTSQATAALPLTGGSLSSGVAITASSGNGINVSTSSGSFPGVYVANSALTGHGMYALADASGARAIEGRSAAGVAVYGSSGTGYAGLFSGRVGVANSLGTALEINQVAGAGNGIHVLTSSANAGIFAETTNTGFATAIAGRANAFNATGITGTSQQGWGIAGVSGSGYGVYGQSDTGLAGRFNGNVSISGTLSKGGGSFQIDHPLDPENKYLYHSFVESPDMKNIYDGVAVLDGSGEAVVELPEWFEALNGDFRYQLTSIGAFMQVYISEEVSNNRFRIAGGVPGKKVSWQVTGIRRDAFANAHRIPVEQDKAEEERGTYLHPEAFDQPKSKGLGEKKDAMSSRGKALGREK